MPADRDQSIRVGSRYVSCKVGEVGTCFGTDTARNEQACRDGLLMPAGDRSDTVNASRLGGLRSDAHVSEGRTRDRHCVVIMSHRKT